MSVWSMIRMKIAIAVQEHLVEQNSRSDDGLLEQALKARGVQVDRINWRDASVDLQQYDAILVTSTWNVHRFTDEFLAWIERCEQGRARLINSAQVLKFGINKDQYLHFLLNKFASDDSSAGSITPSVFIKPDEETSSFSSLRQALQEQASETWSGDMIIKPIVSADGEGTYRLTDNKELLEHKSASYRSFDEADLCMRTLLNKKGSRGVIIQPFIPAVERSGEYQLVFIDGTFTHATVKPRGFKNSATAERRALAAEELPPAMLDFAKQVIDHLSETYPEEITRIRLDFFAGDKGPILCEAELVEPNTNIRRLSNEQQVVVLNQYVNAIISRTQQLNVLAMIKQVLGEGDEAESYLSMIQSPDICKAVMKINEGHEALMHGLEQAPQKYQLAKEHAPTYLHSCFTALQHFSKLPATKDNKKELMSELNHAKNVYCQQVLSKDRSNISKMMRWALKAIVNFIGSLSFGIAHYIHYQKTGSLVFFSGTASEQKINELHHKLTKDINHSLNKNDLK